MSNISVSRSFQDTENDIGSIVLSVRTIRWRRADGRRPLRLLKYATAAVRVEAERLVSDCEAESARKERHPLGTRRYVTIDGVCYVIEAKWRYERVSLVQM